MFAQDDPIVWLYRIKENVNRLLKKQQSYIGKDLVLILGEDKSDKSSLANYLTGCQMKSEFGQSSEIESLHPQAILSEKNIQYVDYRAFYSKRLSDEKIASTIVTQFAIQQANTIRGIIVCLPVECFLDRSKFYQNTDAILFILKDFLSFGQSIQIVVIKTQTHSSLHPQYIMQCIYKFKLQESNNHKNNKNYLINNANLLLNLLVTHPENLHLFHPLDKNVRERIFNKVQKLKPIPQSAFQFPIFDKHHAAFKDVLEKILNNVSDLFEQRNKHRIQGNATEFKKVEQDINIIFETEFLGRKGLCKLAKMANLDLEIVDNVIKLFDDYETEIAAKQQSSSYCRLM